MDLGLKNKIVLVTGSSLGIGKAIAEGFIKEGAKVIVTSNDAQSLKTTYQTFQKQYGKENVLRYLGDLTNPDNIKKSVEFIVNKCKTIDILIANIGSGKSKPGLEPDRTEWERMFNINLWGGAEITRSVIPIMQKNKKGCIVFTASIIGLEPVNAPLPYMAAKSALISTAKGFSRLLAKDNIRVNAIAPGNIKFPGGRWEEIIRKNPSVLEMIKREVPMQRFGSPEEIANIVVFLASDRASFVTGACWVADGGQTRSI